MYYKFLQILFGVYRTHKSIKRIYNAQCIQAVYSLLCLECIMRNVYLSVDNLSASSNLLNLFIGACLPMMQLCVFTKTSILRRPIT